MILILGNGFQLVFDYGALNSILEFRRPCILTSFSVPILFDHSEPLEPLPSYTASANFAQFSRQRDDVAIACDGPSHVAQHVYV